MVQPSTWNDTKQHWISQFLLKGFRIKGRRHDVYELDKETNEVNIRKIADAASKQRLLTVRDEELLGRIESQASRAVGKLRDGRIDITEMERRALDSLVFAMLVDNPYGTFDASKVRAEVIEDRSNKLEAALLRHGGFMVRKGLRALLDENLPYDYLSMSFEGRESLARKMLQLMGLRVHRAVADEPLVIGDSPILVVHNTVDGQTSVPHPGTEIVLPVSSKYVLMYNWTTPSKLIDRGHALDRERVRSLNRGYYHASNSNCIYGSTRDSLEQSRVLQLLWLPQERSVEVNDGWWMMREELQRVQREQVAADAEGMRVYDGVARELVRAAQDAADSPASENVK